MPSRLEKWHSSFVWFVRDLHVRYFIVDRLEFVRFIGLAFCACGIIRQLRINELPRNATVASLKRQITVSIFIQTPQANSCSRFFFFRKKISIQLAMNCGKESDMFRHADRSGIVYFNKVIKYRVGNIKI